MNKKLRLLRTLRKEFAYQCGRNLSLVQASGGLVLLVAMCSALGLWQQQRHNLDKEADRQLCTDEGLIELRLN